MFFLFASSVFFYIFIFIFTIHNISPFFGYRRGNKAEKGEQEVTFHSPSEGGRGEGGREEGVHEGSEEVRGEG